MGLEVNAIGARTFCLGELQGPPRLCCALRPLPRQGSRARIFGPAVQGHGHHDTIATRSNRNRVLPHAWKTCPKCLCASIRFSRDFAMAVTYATLHGAELAKAERDFFEAFGAAMTAWAELETALFYWFSVGLNMNEPMARSLYFS